MLETSQLPFDCARNMLYLYILFMTVVIIHCQDAKKVNWFQDYQYTKENWIQQLSTYISNENGFFQTVILSDVEHKRKVDDVIAAIGKKTHVWHVSIDSEIKSNLRNIHHTRHLGPSTLFLIIKETYDNTSLINLNNVCGIFNVITEITGARSRSKSYILNITSLKECMYKKLLQSLWTKKYLDVSVLEVHEDIQEVLTLHTFNPFDDNYSVSNVSFEKGLFPEKIRDLKGYPLNVGVHSFNNPLLLDVTAGEHDNKIIASGAIAQMAVILSEKVNFTMINRQISYSKNNNVDSFNTRPGYYNFMYMLLTQLAKEKFDFIMIPTEMEVADYAKFESSIFIKYLNLVALVPNTRNYSNYKLEADFLYAAIAILGLIFIIWIVARLLKFDAFWDLMYIVRIVFGITVSKEPKKTTQRIVFAFLFLSCMVYCSWVFSEIKDIFIIQETHESPSTIADLAASKLKISIPDNRFRFLILRDNKLRKLKLLEEIHTISESQCIKMLVSYRNVTCLGYESDIKCSLLKQVETSPYPYKKIMPEAIEQYPLSMKLAPGSPFVERFNDLILKMSEAGLYHKWYNFWHPKSLSNQFRQMEKNGNEISIGYYTFLLLGLYFSIIVFIGELLVSLFLKK